jgi:hypothetical protein
MYPNSFVRLYEDSKKKEERHNYFSHNDLEERKIKANTSHISDKSKEIIENYLRKLFTKLFQTITNNSDIMEENTLALDNVPEFIKTFLTPLLSELIEQNETLTLDEFLLACKQLYTMVPLEQKNLLCEWFNSTYRAQRNVNISLDLTFKVKYFYLIKLAEIK